MKTIYAVLLMCFAGFAFAQEPVWLQEPDPHCDDPEMRALDPKCKKNDGNANAQCGDPQKLWDPNGPGYYVDFTAAHCLRLYCIKVFDEKTKKDVHRWACSKAAGKPKCTGKPVRSCHELKGDECKASYIQAKPGGISDHCKLHSDGACTNGGGECKH